jgi:predicted metal-dependent peptidase
MVRVSFGIDTSGSMGQQMLSDIMSEVVGVTEQFGCFEIDIWCFDTEIHNPQSYTHEDGDAPTHYKLAGGGGTIFQTNWDYMKEVYEEPPELFILLTDGYDCSTIEDTDYCDTIFLVHSNPSYKEPFGKTIKYESDM